MRITLTWLFCLLFLLLASLAVWSAPTGYSDDFTGPLKAGWAHSTTYALTQVDGQLTMRVSKNVMWDGVWLGLGEPHDFSAHPYLNVKVKTDQPCLLHIYFSDGKNVVLRDLRLTALHDFVTLSYDMSKLTVDYTHITGIIVTVNGAATSWFGTINLKDLRIGDKATPLAQVEGVDDLQFYHDSGVHEVRLMGIKNAGTLSLTGAEKLLTNVAFSPIDNGRCTMSFNCVPGAHGAGTATLTAAGEGVYQPYTQAIPVLIEDNLPPTIAAHEAVVVQSGIGTTVRFSGVSDGNITAEQPISFTVQSSKPAVIAPKDVSVEYFTGGRYATLFLKARQSGASTLTITLDDKAGGHSTTQTKLDVRVVKSWNNVPTLDAIPLQYAYIGEGEQHLTLTGITDGDDDTQPLVLAATSSDPTIIPAPIISDVHTDAATLRFTPTAKAGTCTITVTVTDHGGNANNNGDQHFSQTFTLVSRVRPLTAFTEPFATTDALKTLRPEPTVSVSADKDGDTPDLKIALVDQLTYSGLWMTVPGMDVTHCPFLSVDVKTDKPLAFNMYLYDGHDRRNDGANQVKTLQPGVWKTVTFDFTGKGQLEDTSGKAIDTTWVTQLLFNFHPDFNWPFNRYTGNLYLRNMRLGTAADMPRHMPSCTLDAIAAQVYGAKSGAQKLLLTGIGSEAKVAVTVATARDGSAGLTDLQLSPLGTDGRATLHYTVNGVGRDTVTVTVAADGATTLTQKFTVDVLEAAPLPGTAVTIDTTKHFQTMTGIGTMICNIPTTEYTGLLGASAMRVGDELQGFLPQRDTLDPQVIYPGAYNFDFIDFAHVRALHEAGVENIFYSSWSPPAWMKTSHSSNAQQPSASGDSNSTTNRLDFDEYDAFAKLMVELVRSFKEEADVDLYAIGMQNEPAFEENYGSAILDPHHFVQLIKVVGRRFAKEGIKTKLLMPEQVFNYDWMKVYLDALNADPEAVKFCDIIATHGYDTTGTKDATKGFANWKALWDLSQHPAHARELWMSEGEPTYTGWDSSLQYGVTLNNAFTVGNMSLWTTFGPEGDLVYHNAPNSSFYVVRQYARYFRPGAVRVDGVSPNPQVRITTFLNDAKHGGKLAAVLVNTADTSQAVHVTIAGQTVKNWRVITTDAIRNGADRGSVPGDGSLLLPPSSVTTIVEE